MKIITGVIAVFFLATIQTQASRSERPSTADYGRPMPAELEQKVREARQQQAGARPVPVGETRANPHQAGALLSQADDIRIYQYQPTTGHKSQVCGLRDMAVSVVAAADQRLDQGFADDLVARRLLSLKQELCPDATGLRAFVFFDGVHFTIDGRELSPGDIEASTLSAEAHAMKIIAVADYGWRASVEYFRSTVEHHATEDHRTAAGIRRLAVRNFKTESEHAPGATAQDASRAAVKEIAATVNGGDPVYIAKTAADGSTSCRRVSALDRIAPDQYRVTSDDDSLWGLIDGHIGFMRLAGEFKVADNDKSPQSSGAMLALCNDALRDDDKFYIGMQWKAVEDGVWSGVTGERECGIWGLGALCFTTCLKQMPAGWEPYRVYRSDAAGLAAARRDGFVCSR